MIRKLVLLLLAFSLTALAQAQQKKISVYCDGYVITVHYGSACERCKYTTCCVYSCDTCEGNCTTSEDWCEDCTSGVL